MDDASNTVSEIIASGVIPAAIEMMDEMILQAVEADTHAGYPLDAAAVLLMGSGRATRSSNGAGGQDCEYL